MKHLTMTTRAAGLCAAALLTLSACGDDGPGGGGGSDVDPAAIASEDELVEMIGGETVCGDGSLDLHRGHRPVQSTLEEILGISHDQMHVYMEDDGMNLGAVADEVGLGRDALDDALVEHFAPAVDGLVEDGTLSEEAGEDYRAQIETVLDYRIDWDGEQAPLEVCTAST